MAFVIVDGSVTSFAEYEDVLERDGRIFQENEGFTDTEVDDLLIRSTQRVVAQVKASPYWRELNLASTTFAGLAEIPEPDLNRFQRQQDFTDITVYHCLAEFILPKIADFGNEDSSESRKMEYYRRKYTEMLNEMFTMGDFYDVDLSGEVESDEKLTKYSLTRRSRGRRNRVGGARR